MQEAPGASVDEEIEGAKEVEAQEGLSHCRLHEVPREYLAGCEREVKGGRAVGWHGGAVHGEEGELVAG